MTAGRWTGERKGAGVLWGKREDVETEPCHCATCFYGRNVGWIGNTLVTSRKVKSKLIGVVCLEPFSDNYPALCNVSSYKVFAFNVLRLSVFKIELVSCFLNINQSYNR